MVSLRRLTLGVVLGLLCASPALAFGTIIGMGQNAEHERITRHALVCTDSTTDCFQPASLDALAGGKGNWGAVGIPDRGDLIPVNKMHCDGGDWLDIHGYPQTREAAQAALVACRNWMIQKLNDAVRDAGKLVNDENNVRQSQILLPCTFQPEVKENAKCTVLADFGMLLHASQDFYAHTNWVDHADSVQPTGPANVPGLAKEGRASWIDLRKDTPFPGGLISGCFENAPEEKYCNYGAGLSRAKRLTLNKDMGTIDPQIGRGTTPRGLIDDNFARAVEAAIDDTRDKWATLEEQLASTYGDGPGARMACVLTHDRPLNVCP